MADLFGPGFDSLQLHLVQYQKALKACKSIDFRLFCFQNDVKSFNYSQNVGECFGE